MDVMSWIKLNVDTTHNKIDVIVKFIFSRNINETFSFGLGNMLEVYDISCNQFPCTWETKDDLELPFRLGLQQISVDLPMECNVIELRYSGKVNGWSTNIGPDCVMLNYYSAWYPIFLTKTRIKYNVEIDGLHGFQLVNSTYDEDKRV